VNGEILDLNGRGVSDGGALRNISGNNTYNGLIELNSTNRINSDAGTLTVSSFANGLSSTRSLFVGGAGNTVISGALDGSSTGRLVKDGTGTLTISGANTVNGGITVGAGSLIVSSTGSIIEAGSSVIISNGAYLGYNGTTALRTASISIEAGGTLELGTSGSMRFVVGTNGANTVSGAGTAIFKERSPPKSPQRPPTRVPLGLSSRCHPPRIPGLSKWPALLTAAALGPADPTV
jgi:autotransporter-associated beta strand protein